MCENRQRLSILIEFVSAPRLIIFGSAAIEPTQNVRLGTLGAFGRNVALGMSARCRRGAGLPQLSEPAFVSTLLARIWSACFQTGGGLAPVSVAGHPRKEVDRRHGWSCASSPELYEALEKRNVKYAIRIQRHLEGRHHRVADAAGWKAQPRGSVPLTPTSNPDCSGPA